jgi:molybdopterin/thiamine biosynthesis adenylyltransferase
MNDQQLLRYSRHILLPEIGINGQEKLLAAHALVIGVGGLGSPAAMYLAASGVGRLTLCDGDVVDLTNLQRQLLHRTSTIGQPKVQSARMALADINPGVEIISIPHQADEQQLATLVAQADVVLDCSDNFATRYALNRTCLAHGKPLISGAATRFEGQLSIFDFRSKNSPCYNCLYPEQHEAEETRCAVMGVFAPLVGVIGALQAAEAIKLLLNTGTVLYGRLLIADILNTEIREARLSKDPACPVCGKS